MKTVNTHRCHFLDSDGMKVETKRFGDDKRIFYEVEIFDEGSHVSARVILTGDLEFVRKLFAALSSLAFSEPEGEVKPCQPGTSPAPTVEE